MLRRAPRGGLSALIGGPQRRRMMRHGRSSRLEKWTMAPIRTVADLCTRDVASVPRATALNEAARLMRERHVGCLVVVDETREGRIVAGLLTDRDIVTAVVARDVSTLMLSVADVMSEEITTVHEGASVHEAIALMHHRRVRRMPVVTSGGALVGLVSADDLLRSLAGELQRLAATLGDQRKLEQIARP
jgi:CBS domain-containing protein